MNYYNEYPEPEYEEKELFEEAVTDDVRKFFLKKDHWIYQYGSPSKCDINSPYHRKQIEVLFEKKYFQWVTGRAVDTLIKEGFLKEEKGEIGNFVYRSDIRYIKRKIKEREKIIKRYSDPTITKAIGAYAEMLFSFLFEIQKFNVVGRDTNEYSDRKWKRTKDRLDFILEKSGLSYGIEVKNTLGYIEKEEFWVKIEMCKYLGLIPLWILRSAPATQMEDIKRNNGFIILFKTQIYPPGQEPLVRDIWNYTRLPVNVWKELPPKIKMQVERVHENFKKIHKKSRGEKSNLDGKIG